MHFEESEGDKGISMSAIGTGGSTGCFVFFLDSVFMRVIHSVISITIRDYRHILGKFTHPCINCQMSESPARERSCVEFVSI